MLRSRGADIAFCFAQAVQTAASSSLDGSREVLRQLWQTRELGKAALCIRLHLGDSKPNVRAILMAVITAYIFGNIHKPTAGTTDVSL